MSIFKLKEPRKFLHLNPYDSYVILFSGRGSKEVLEKKPKQKYKDRKYHQQERFDPVYVKEIRQKVYLNFLSLVNDMENAINAINKMLLD